MPIIIVPESINELTLICVLIQSRLKRSGGWDKKSVALRGQQQNIQNGSSCN